MRAANESVLIETRPLAGSLKEFQPVTISLVNDTELEPVFRPYGEKLPLSWLSQDDWSPDQIPGLLQGCAYRRLKL